VLARAFWMSLFDIVLTRPGVEPFVGLNNRIEQLTSGDFWRLRGGRCISPSSRQPWN
jgi:hypothetical protein